jgi:hypothetical protein
MEGDIMTKTALRTTAVSALALAALFAASGAHAETVLRLAHASSTASLINEAVTRFADEVAEKSNGELTVQIFPDAQLGDEGPIADGVGAGSIDIGLGGVVDAIDPTPRRRTPSSTGRSESRSSTPVPTPASRCWARSIPASASSPTATIRS